MTEKAAAATAPAVVAAKKPRAKAEHPTFAVMIAAAITSMKERKGSSRQAIEKYICANYKVGPKFAGPLKQALRKGVEANTFVQTKGVGASGSFKVAKPEPVKKAAPVKKPAAKKAPAKKTVTKKVVKKVTKKPAVKKAPAKAAKKTVTKKAPAKKAPVKKTAAKKPAAKKSTGKVTKKPAKKTTAKKAKK